MTVVTWLGADLVTGQIIEELPEITPQGPLSQRLAAYTSAVLSLPLALAGKGAPPRNWLTSTEPGRTMIVAVLGGNPIWAGIVVKRVGGTAAQALLSTVSVEGYLDRRFVTDHTWTDQDEASVIATGLIGDANTTEGIGLTVDAPATGVLRVREYLAKDDKTVYSALRELTGVVNGPEWTIQLGWTDSSQTTVEKIFQVRPRIGIASAAPNAVFTNAVFASAAESNAVYQWAEDYTDGRGSNHVIAVSSGEGDARPQSSPARDEDLFAAGWPRWEHRFTPSTSISDVGVLDAHAQSALALQRIGAVLVSISSRADAYPVLGRDWASGDDIGYELTGHRHPASVTGVARCIGWDFDPVAGLVTPILLGSEE